MLLLKHLILQVLILMILSANINCSPVNPPSDKDSCDTGDEVDNATPNSGNPNILSKAQFETSGLTLLTPNPPPSDNSYGRIVCETSNASPFVWNSRRLAYWLFGNFGGWYCCNWNVNGGGCSLVMTIDDASTAICGAQGCIKCDDLAWDIVRIGNDCLRNDRAGGVSYLDQGSHIVVY
ncbi:hypothetical protein HOY82DRAFT_616754 [Tuber indicum]|nr:hypothetical protein HOY82DRAFT_616754 [Tuber indicum]